MILRSIGVRHGRKALSTPLARASLRSLTTDSSRPPAAADAPAPVPQRPVKLRTKYQAENRLKASTRAVGSDVEVRYAPGLLMKNPLPPKHVTLERLMAAQTHMGHHSSLWNPANSRYIYGVRQGTHIISLETTAAHLRRASTVVEEVSYRGGLVLFVGTRKGQMEIVTAAASEAKACHLFTKWTPGAITNRDIILRDRLLKIVDEKDTQLAGFDRHLNQARPLLPDLVVCLNPLENYTMLYECGLASIPTIGIIDTDADPSWVTYTIPANDDSLRSVAFIAGVLGQAGKQGHRRRLASAADGQVTWETPQDITSFIKTMASQRGEILAALVDKEIIGGLREPSQAETEAAALESREEQILEAVSKEEALSDDLLDEEDELIRDLTSDNAEMDAMSNIEKEILESFAKEQAKGLGEGDEVTDEAIMSRVGVEKGVPEVEKKPGKDE